MSAPARPEMHTRWNFVVIVLDASSFAMGIALVDPVAVLPVLLANLGASNAVIGLVGTIQRAGWLMPQLLSASIVLHRPRRWGFVFYPCLVSRIPFYLLAVALLHPWSRTHQSVLLPLIIVTYALFYFGDGLCGVPWHDIIARSIPTTMRGRFFGSMQAFSGLLGVGSAAVVDRILGNRSLPFPQNYGLLFAGLCVGLTLSTLFLYLIREPVPAPVSEAQTLPSLIRSIPQVLRDHPRLLRSIIGQNLCGLTGLAGSFYAVYATKQLHVPESLAGLFVSAGVLGAVGSSFIWAYLSDRKGPTRVIRGVAWMMGVTPAMALLVPWAARHAGLETGLPYLYAAVFLCNSTVAGGAWMGFTNYVFEIAPERLRPIFLGLQATLSAPSVFMPWLGGTLLKVMSYQTLFAIVAVAGVLGALYVRLLAEPRHAPTAA